MRAVIIDPVSQLLMDSIHETSSKHQVFSYNIANALTPGFKPLRLPEEADHTRSLRQMGLDDKVVIEDELNKLAENQSKHDAYLRLMSMKRGVLTQVIRQGK